MIRFLLLNQGSAGSLNLILSLSQLSLHLIKCHSSEDIQGSQSLGNGLDLRIILRKTIQGIEDEHDTERNA